MELHFELENKCLLKCLHCSSYASSDGRACGYSIENVVDFVSSADDDNVIFLTGGEPLLNEFLDRLMESIVNIGKQSSIGLFTSGVIGRSGNLRPVSDAHAKKLVRHGLKVCYFSIYSHDSGMHDWMTRTPGSLDITKKSLCNLRNAGVEIRFNTVVTRKNRNIIDKIIDFAQTCGAVEVRLLKLIQHGRACSCWSEIGLSEDEYRSIVRRILAKETSIRVTASGAVDVIPCRPCSNSLVCPAGSGILYVTHEGEIYPCASVKNKPWYSIGILSDKSTWKKYFENRFRFVQPLCIK